MLVFLTWAFELAAAAAIGGMATGVALLAGLYLLSQAGPRNADISTPPVYAVDDASKNAG